MGFYGNITNTSNTTFSFDRIYSNKREMDSNVNNDGIFIGRYVLVEYDQDAAYPVVFMNKQTNKFYSSKNFDQATEIRYISGDKSDEYILTTDTSVVSGKQYYKLENDKYIDVSLNSNDNPRALGLYEYVSTSDGVYKDEIVQVQEVTSDEKTGNLITIFIGFYQCEGTYDGEHAQFKQLDKDPNAAKSNYIKNFAIDEKHLNGEQQKSFKGYDSTVWMKSSVTASDGKLITKYVNIADLNSVVPTFDIAADAPTMNPITPHFDADSTNVYYKLHMQSPYGFRVAKKPEGGISDADTVWYETTYDKTQDKTETKKVYEGPADIYYNEAGFSPDAPSVVSNTAEDNYIKLEPTASSGATYSHGAGANDIQEFRLHLPAIGNMMSKAWDIVHGPNRDDYRGDGENSSLQGRLDAFQDICANQIAVKSSDEDGTIVGSKINNGEKYVHEGDILDKRLNVEDEGLLNNDDPWIRTYINTTDLVHSTYRDDSGLSQEDNNGIAIQHTFHATADSETSLDKNNGEAQVSERQEKYIHAIKDSNSNIIKTPINAKDGNTTDEIKLYTPYVDATGHVVGKNIETVTLPYGYKTIKTNGRGEDTEINTFDKVAAKTQNIVAENTQDELAINSGNKWIRIDTDATNNILTISHDIHKTSSDSHDTDWTQTEANTTIPTTTYEFDNAGHYVSHHTENYKLPFGYGKIVGDSGSTEATATFDELTISADDNWIATSVSDDQVNITHTGPVVTSVTNKSNIVDPNFGSTFIIEDWYFDAKGHKHTGKAHTVQFPKGSLNDLTATGSSVLTGISMNDDTGDITQQNANVGTLTLTEYTQGQSGRLTISDTNTINGAFKGIQDYINTLDMSNTSSTQFITKITQIDGQVAVERAAAGTLQLGTPSTDGTIPENSSLNNAFNITNTRFKTNEDALAREVQDRKDAITKEINDRNSAISSAISAIVDKDDDGTINKLAEVIEWINNNPSTATQMQKAIQDNTKAISDEANLARSEEGKIATALTTETGRAIAAELGLQEQIDALGTAAQKDIEDFATATQGTTAETTAATIATYGDIVTYNAEDFVLKSEYNALLSDFNELKTLVEQLNNQINPPQQPDNSGEIV